MRLSLKRFGRKKVVEVDIVPTDGPITPSGVEKFVYHNGSYDLVYRPRINNFMNGKKAGGTKVLIDGTHTNSTVLIDLSEVVYRVAMGWSHAQVCLVDAPDLPLPSEF